jgi:hypothetical protein
MGKTTSAERSVHESREAELREDAVHDEEDEVWEQNLALKAPLPRKGFRQRFIRVMLGGKDDHSNISKKLRDGWKPREVATLPKNYYAPIIESGRFSGFIGIQGGVLMEMTEKRAQAREKFYAKLTRGRTAALDSQLQQVGRVAGGRGFGPIESDKKSVAVREVMVAPDEE